MRHSVNLAIDLVRDGWDGGDPWGSGLGSLFAVASVMDAAGFPVPAEIGYQRAMFDNRTLADLAHPEPADDVSFEEMVLAEAVLSGDLDEHTLTLAARTLNRYLDAVPEADRY